MFHHRSPESDHHDGKTTSRIESVRFIVSAHRKVKVSHITLSVTDCDVDLVLTRVVQCFLAQETDYTRYEKFAEKAAAETQQEFELKHDQHSSLHLRWNLVNMNCLLSTPPPRSRAFLRAERH